MGLDNPGDSRVIALHQDNSVSHLMMSDVLHTCAAEIKEDASAVSNAVGSELRRHPIFAGIVVGFPATITALRYGPELGAGIVMTESRLARWVGIETAIHTADPLRSLIRLEGYGGRRNAALAMEGIVSSARQGIAGGELRTADDVENFIARNYLPKLRGSSRGIQLREYTTADMLEKHQPYASKLHSIVDQTSEHTASAEINGKQVNFIRTIRSDLFDWRNGQTIKGVVWNLPKDPEVFEAADDRTDQLFKELLASNAVPKTEAALTDNLERVAEMEWLNAQTWKYARGSAGVSQLEARTWLETAGIDSGRYKVGIDPNLEALRLSLPEYKKVYPTFFQSTPRYFDQPGFWSHFLPRSVKATGDSHIAA